MADILFFHHAQGLTPGVLSFADRLRTAGHTVITPDLYDGRTFDSLDEGVAYADELGAEKVIAAGVAAAEVAPPTAFYFGMSLGSLPAQKLAQTRPGASGAVLMHGGIPPEWFDSPWPATVPVQIHQTEFDPWADERGPTQLVAASNDGTLYTYAGFGHLIADDSLPEFEPESAALIEQRALDFVAKFSG
jgi:dienelactone hydrolase